jgi:hypothetical protein
VFHLSLCRHEFQKPLLSSSASKNKSCYVLSDIFMTAKNNFITTKRIGSSNYHY